MKAKRISSDNVVTSIAWNTDFFLLIPAMQKINLLYSYVTLRSFIIQKVF